MTAVTLLNVPTVSNSTLVQQRAWTSLYSMALGRCGLTRAGLPGFGVIRRDSLAAFGVAGTTATIVIPPTVQVGDLMVAQVTVAGSGTTISTPSGWTAQHTDAGAGTNSVNQAVFTKVAASGDIPATGAVTGVTLSFTLGTSNLWTINFVAYWNVATVTPVNIVGAAVSSINGTTLTAASVTTTAPYCLVVQCFGGNSTGLASTMTPGSGTIEAKTAAATNISAAIGEVMQVASGASATPTATASVTGSWVVTTLAIAPIMNLVPTTATATTGGSLAAATYYYRVSATNGVGGNGVGTSLPCAEVSQVVPGGTSTNTVTITWAQVAGATGYKVYGRSTGAELLIGTVALGSTLSFLDDGTVTPSGALPIADTSMDTGQLINGTVVLNAGGTGVVFGYEIYQLTDTLQASTPCYIRVGYCSGSGATFACVTTMFGTATDGAGNVAADARWANSARTAAAPIVYTGGSITGTMNWYFNGDGSSFMAAWQQPGLATFGALGCLERVRDYDGTPSANGVWLISGLATGAPAQAGYYTGPGIASGYLVTVAGGYSHPPANYLIWDPTPSTGLIANVLYTFPISTGSGWPGMGGDSKFLVAYWAADLPVFNTITLSSFYGGSHVFMAMGAGVAGGFTSTGAAGMSVAFRMD